VPALEALVARFEAANTLAVGVSVDSVFSHANWAASLGGVSLPLLADFHPKGAVAASFGLYLEDKGITDRATVIIDADGVVRHASSVGPAGSRDIAELAALCEQIDKDYAGELPTHEPAAGLDGEVSLYVKEGCGFSRAALLSITNLHLSEKVATHYIDKDPKAAEALDEIAGKKQVPALICDGVPMLESGQIIRHLVTKVTGLWP